MKNLMKQIPIVRFLMVITMGVVTFSTLASATPLHVMHNLESHQEQELKQVLEKKGYSLKGGKIFSESESLLIITKNIGNTFEEEYLEIEILRKNKNERLPKTVSKIRLKNLDELYGKPFSMIPASKELRQIQSPLAEHSL